MFKYKKTLGGILLGAVVLGGALYWRNSGSAAPSYREAAVTRGDLEIAVLTTGIVQPRNRLEIKPPVAGRVEEMLVREGQNVNRGQLLAWMSSTERAALIDAARAKGADELKRWEELYRPTPIYAPVAGMVIDRKVEPGQTVTNNDPVLVMSDRLIIVAQVDETDIAQVRLRQPTRITFDAYPENAMPGVVEQIAFDAKTVNNVITYEVNVLPEKIPPFMRSGMTANVSFVVQEKRDVLLVPAEAVRRRAGQSHVLIPSAERVEPVEKSMEPGLSDGRRTEVIAGLAEGEKILVPPLAKPTRAGGRSNPLTPGGGRR